MDKTLKATCDLNIPEETLVYVCLDGRAQSVTIEEGDGNNLIKFSNFV